MWKLVPLALVQSIFLSLGHVFLKMGMMRMGAFAWTREYWFGLLTNWWLLACGIAYGGATVLWLYILKHFPFSVAYPLSSLSYVFGMLAAIVFFHEEVSVMKWVGVLLIAGGCVLIMK